MVSCQTPLASSLSPLLILAFNRLTPLINSPAVTIVVPSQVNILLGGYGEDGEEFFFCVAQVNWMSGAHPSP
jgi:hypothetical protein